MLLSLNCPEALVYYCLYLSEKESYVRKLKFCNQIKQNSSQVVRCTRKRISSDVIMRSVNGLSTTYRAEEVPVQELVKNPFGWTLHISYTVDLLRRCAGDTQHLHVPNRLLFFCFQKMEIQDWLEKSSPVCFALEFL